MTEGRATHVTSRKHEPKSGASMASTQPPADAATIILFTRPSPVNDAPRP